MQYARTDITDEQVPRATDPLFQHVVDTYAGEENKVASVWRCFTDSDLAWQPDPKSMTVEGICKHQLLSERRFFAEFLGMEELPANEALPAPGTLKPYIDRLTAAARKRLEILAIRDKSWWLEEVQFFDTRRQRIWIFWRRVLHTAHHRTQLATYLRQLGRPVPATYGPTADQTWTGADPTNTVDAAGRK
ncbi:MAG: hypothetical protein HYX27_16080 [Acidobacteria bacterium]|nr:hypothetical protein [Acidobacteriota bacterium]